MKQIKKSWIIAAAVVLVVGGGLVAVKLRQSDSAEPRPVVLANPPQLDAERRALDMSMNIYSPVTDRFSIEYGTAFAEERPPAETAAIKAGVADVMERERLVNTGRLQYMETSVAALGDPAVKDAFTTFKQRYGAVVDYYAQYRIDAANVTESVAGPCAKLAQVNFAKKSFATDYTQAADSCLAALAAAKQSSSPTATTLLTDVEGLVQKRRVSFEKAIGGEGARQTAANITALLTLLDVNEDLKVIQTRYETTEKTLYAKLVNDANSANEAFGAALKPLVATAGPKKDGGRPDYQATKDVKIGELKAARAALAPAVNKYLAAYKAAYNEQKSPEAASQKASPEYEAFKTAEQKASAASNALAEDPVSGDEEIGTAIELLKRDYDAEVTFFKGLVESYPAYTSLFSESSQQCSGLLVGKDNGLDDRKAKLDAAAARCQVALDGLKKSVNSTYADYALKIERRMKQLQEYAAATAQGERELAGFQAEVAGFQNKVAEAEARNAPDAELLALAAEIKGGTAKIKESKAGFDFAARGYLRTVKELPVLFGDVYDKQVPARLKTYGKVNDARTDVLSFVLEGKIASA
ncbi:hypothetical protein [Actinoplanes sp. NPDC051859]|uniref:hypothetical protein n=1 Tax=Actinoplanes sp. NPDC051859 TaxID=3363909 RepID=UPI0037BA95ED